MKYIYIVFLVIGLAAQSNAQDILIKELKPSSKSRLKSGQRLMDLDLDLLRSVEAAGTEYLIETGTSSKRKRGVAKVTSTSYYFKNLKAYTSTGQPITKDIGEHFYIKINDDSKLVLSVFDNTTYGLYIDARSTYSLSEIDRKNNNKLSLVLSEAEQDGFHCGNDVKDHSQQLMAKVGAVEAYEKNAQSVSVYSEADYSLYQEFNQNETAVRNYVMGILHQAFSLFEMANVSMTSSEIFVWTEQDPYGAANAVTLGPVLDAFKCQNPNFNGRIAHLFSATSTIGGSGLGEVPDHTACPSSGLVYGVSKFVAHSESNINYPGIVGLVTHELGHELGSDHTHDCVWGADRLQIDDCGIVAGLFPPTTCYNSLSPILPGQNGTIMSYCNVTAGQGINLQAGFHPLVATRISAFANSCLSFDICPNVDLKNISVESFEGGTLILSMDASSSNADVWQVNVFNINNPIQNSATAAFTSQNITFNNINMVDSYLFLFAQRCGASIGFSNFSCPYSLESLLTPPDTGDGQDCTTTDSNIYGETANMNVITSATTLTTAGIIDVTSINPLIWQATEVVILNNNVTVGNQVSIEINVGPCNTQ